MTDPRIDDATSLMHAFAGHAGPSSVKPRGAAFGPMPSRSAITRDWPASRANGFLDLKPL